jgi:hypothetical protein
MTLLSGLRVWLGIPVIVVGAILMWIGIAIGGEPIAEAVMKAILKSAREHATGKGEDET